MIFKIFESLCFDESNSETKKVMLKIVLPTHFQIFFNWSWESSQKENSFSTKKYLEKGQFFYHLPIWKLQWRFFPN